MVSFWMELCYFCVGDRNFNCELKVHDVITLILIFSFSSCLYVID